MKDHFARADPDGVDSGITPNISHQMNELLRLLLNPRQPRQSKLRTSSQTATTTDLQPGQNAICLPAPVRFTRKSKPTDRMNNESSAEGKSTRSEPPCPSPQNKSILIPLTESYHELLQTLMNFDHDRSPSDTSAVRYADAQLNEPR